ncbi:MAG: flagellar assembly protein FliW [Bacillota bacterium]|jgi:flagellar assembly factor FliW
MEITTKDFGIINIKEQEIIHFPKGIFSFEEAKKFIFINSDDYSAICLQAVDNVDPRFIVFNPLDIMEDYSPMLPEGVMQQLEATSLDELCFFVIAVIPQKIQDMTVNLKSPIVVNPYKRLGMQVILENQDYQIRHSVYDEKERGGGEC